jgi:hypothetical protein
MIHDMGAYIYMIWKQIIKRLMSSKNDEWVATEIKNGDKDER